MPWRGADGALVGTFGISKDITSIKEAEAKLEELHKELLATSREAGMAEVATSVLHNVGNVLTSVNVASACVAKSLRESQVTSLSRVVGLLNEHEADLGNFVTNDPKGKLVITFLGQLAERLTQDQTVVLKELEDLEKNISHIKEIVSLQQSCAKVSGDAEELKVTELVEDALRINANGISRRDIRIIKEFEPVPCVAVEKHKALQILVNLVRNATQACDESGREGKQLTLRVALGAERVRITVQDNGVGISSENLSRIFRRGFTTKKDGHGFGLYSGVVTANEMGGALLVNSDGPGLGASFTLELPVAVGLVGDSHP
jgi:signal transduction histidine kinase